MPIPVARRLRTHLEPRACCTVYQKKFHGTYGIYGVGAAERDRTAVPNGCVNYIRGKTCIEPSCMAVSDPSRPSLLNEISHFHGFFPTLLRPVAGGVRSYIGLSSQKSSPSGLHSALFPCNTGPFLPPPDRTENASYPSEVGVIYRGQRLSRIGLVGCRTVGDDAQPRDMHQSPQYLHLAPSGAARIEDLDAKKQKLSLINQRKQDTQPPG
ncbi:hypothetical protein BO70DRAFT_378874 [Aspergillus heteromorphus CBS 117.55]|uniref:Uncharacterized protein n=1 Tax=Aspergillus heteromorphus CBS 117.55 TaxID=1448321 RepID=A0A317WIF0_9EURO|nr:uncharacterized protein BO70DRAFT_378874 [Aspergillus heteromorphus CBS 117.55]PWY86254.1 hypothetical protein BO70DRAFT_378874 [Aspergillus heteromorphus CBS 117.55]